MSDRKERGGHRAHRALNCRLKEAESDADGNGSKEMEPSMFESSLIEYNSKQHYPILQYQSV